MRNLLKLLYAYYFVILFIFLECLSLFLIIENNQFQRAKFIQFAQNVSGSIFGTIDNFKAYLSLKEANKILATENAQLHNELASIHKIEKVKKDTAIDLVHKQHYTYMASRVINNSVSKQYNFITLNKGIKDGIKQDMAVISPLGIVGVVEGVSENYATVLSVLNRNFKVSAKIKKNHYFGTLSWNGLNSEICILSDIPHHVLISKGDTIITSGYSNVFPEGIMIGVIQEFDLKDGNFYTIRVKLSNDFRNLNYVMVVDNLMKNEQFELEKKAEHD
jgi:rod shape-determining protein MreC